MAELTVELTCYDGQSGDLSKVELDTTPFGEKVRMRLLRQACLHYAAARRLGCHSTKSRGEIACSGRKPWKQKGTGRARAGDSASPIWKGGGVAFGPKPRNYTSAMPRRMRKEALRSALLGKLRDGEVKLVDGLDFERPRTRSALAVLEALGCESGRTTLVIAERGENLLKSFRNLRSVEIAMASDLHAEQVVRCHQLVLDRKALDQLIARLSDVRSSEVRATP